MLLQMQLPLRAITQDCFKCNSGCSPFHNLLCQNLSEDYIEFVDFDFTPS
jgi:hypothetical protein